MSTALFELTGFQRDLLLVISGMDRPSGQDVKTELESQLGDITHARLYPNLDTLVEEGFVEKGAIDRRTNSYSLTESGYEALREYQRWSKQYLSQAAPADTASETYTTTRLDTTY